MISDLLKVIRRQRHDSRSSTTQASAQEPRVRLGRYTLQDLRQTWDESLAIWLVDLVLHRQVDELWVWRRLAQSRRQERYTLQVEHDIWSSIACRQHLSRLCRRNLEIGNNDDTPNLRRPLELVEVSNVERWLGGVQARVHAAGVGEHFGDWDLEARDVGGLELVEVGADEATVEGRSDVIGVALDHQAVVEDAGLGEAQLAGLIGEDDAGNDSRARGAETATERDGVNDVDVGVLGEDALAVAAEDVECDFRDEVDLRVERDVRCALALVRYAAVERERGGFGGIDGDLQLEVHRQSEADDIKARANVGRRAWSSDCKFRGGHGVKVEGLFGVRIEAIGKLPWVDNIIKLCILLFRYLTMLRGVAEGLISTISVT